MKNETGILTTKPNEPVDAARAGTGTQLTADSIQKAVEEMRKLVDESELAVWMRSLGFDPQEGGTLYIPEVWKELFEGVELPPYVRYARVLLDNKPFIMKRQLDWGGDIFRSR